MEFFGGFLLRRRELGWATAIDMHGHFVVGNTVITSAQEREVGELTVAPFGQLPEALAACSVFLCEKNWAAALAHEEDMLIYFHRRAAGFLSRELFWFAGDTEIPDGTSRACR